MITASGGHGFREWSTAARVHLARERAAHLAKLVLPLFWEDMFE